MHQERMLETTVRKGRLDGLVMYHGRPQAWARAGGTCPLEMLESVSCISIYSKTLGRPIIYALLSNLSSASGGFVHRPPPGLHPGPH